MRQHFIAARSTGDTTNVGGPPGSETAAISLPALGVIVLVAFGLGIVVGLALPKLGGQTASSQTPQSPGVTGSPGTADKPAGITLPPMAVDAAEVVVQNWLDGLNQIQGQRDVYTNSGDPQKTGPTYLETRIVNQGKVDGRPFTARDVAAQQVPSNQNGLQVSWMSQALKQDPSGTRTARFVSGEAEIEHVHVSFVETVSPTSAEARNGVQWRGSITLDFSVRHRANVIMGANVQQPSTPTHAYSCWATDRVSAQLERVNDAWRFTPSGQTSIPAQFFAPSPRSLMDPSCISVNTSGEPPAEVRIVSRPFLLGQISTKNDADCPRIATGCEVPARPGS